MPESVTSVVRGRLNEPVRSRSELMNAGPVVVALILGLGVRLGGIGIVALADGNITPVPWLTDVTAVPPDMVKIAVPKLLVEFVVLTSPLKVPINHPDVALGRMTSEVVGMGVTAPPPPVEKKTEVFPPTLSCAEPDMIDSEAVIDRLGMLVPAPPVKLEVDVAPPTVSTWLPNVTNCVPAVGREMLELKVWLADEESVSLPVPWPLPPVAFAVKVDPDMANSAPPDEAGRPVEMGKLSCAALVDLVYPLPPSVKLDVAVEKA